jgi:hypothetical protein
MRRKDLKKRTYVLAKNTKADEEVLRAIPSCIYVGESTAKRFVKLPPSDPLAHDNIEAFVGVFVCTGGRKVCAHFRR